MVDNLFADVSSIAQLAERVATFRKERFPQEVWDGAALACTFNRDLYGLFAATGPPFSEFVSQPDFIPLDPSAESYRLRDGVRERLLLLLLKKKEEESPALRSTSLRILDYAKEHHDRFEELAQRAVVTPNEGEALFDQLFSEADEAFDLGRCEALLALLRGRFALLGSRLQEKVEAREQYLSARLLFLQDHYRSASYLNRQVLLDTFRTFIEGPRLKRLRGSKWLLNIYGKGGAGKSIFLRWVISRHCIPAYSDLRTPVARLDIDFINRSLLARQPWLALLSTAAQLRPQMSGMPFGNLAGPDETALRNRLHNSVGTMRAQDDQAYLRTGEQIRDDLIEKFCSGLGSRTALLVFDTVEELSIHRPDVLGSLLTLLQLVHQRCPGVRVVLSGRNPVFDPERPLPGLSTGDRKQLADACADYPIPPMDPDESEHYLLVVRAISPSQPISEIVKAADGNPFALALFADLAHLRPLTVEEVKTSDVAFAYLIERIIDHIPDEDESPEDSDEIKKHKRTQRGLRWLLRYAVVPRRVTKSFAEAVLAPFVRDELRASTGRDDPNNLALAGPRYRDRQPWKHLGLPVEFDDLWTALQSYASSSSWVSGSGDTLDLQPEIVVPMRRLLSQNTGEYRIWSDLHRAAAAYFESLAREGDVGKNLAEALFHRFQSEGAAAHRWWADYLARCRASDDYLSAIRELADSLFGTDYLDDEGRPRLNHSQESIVADRTLSAAALESCLAQMIEEMRWPEKDRHQLRAAISTRFADLQKYSSDRSGARSRLAQLVITTRGIDPAAVNERPQLDPSELNYPDERIATALLRANELGVDTETSRRWYAAALATAQEATKSHFPPFFLQSILARVDAIGGRSEEAFDQLCASATSAVEQNASADEIADLMRRAMELGWAIGQWPRIDDLAKRVSDAPAPAREEAVSWRLRLALDGYDFDRAETLVRDFNTENEAARHANVADFCAATLQMSRAEQEYDEAQKGYEKARSPTAVARVLLSHARSLLNQADAPRRSSAVLQPLAGATFLEPLVELEFNLLSLRQQARLGNTGVAHRHFERLVMMVRAPGAPMPAHLPLVFATAVAEGVGSDAVALELESLLDHAAAAAKLAALRPFLEGDGRRRMPRGIRLPADNLRAPVQGRLSLAAALIFFGQSDAAMGVLEGIRRTHANSPDILAVVYRVARRISPTVLRPPPNWRTMWKGRGSAVGAYVGVVLLEHAERALADGATSEARLAFADSSLLIRELPPDSGWRALFTDLELRLQQDSSPSQQLSRELARMDRAQLLSPRDYVSIALDTSAKGICVQRVSLGRPEESWTLAKSPLGVAQALVAAADAAELYAKMFANKWQPRRGLEDTATRMPRIIRQILAPFGTWSKTDLRIGVVGIWSNGGFSFWQALAYAWRRGVFAPIRRLVQSASRKAEHGSAEQGDETAAAPESATPWAPAIAVEAAAPAIAAMPWEFAHTGVEAFFRTATGAPLEDTVRYLRRSIQLLELPQTATDDTWQQVIRELGGHYRFRRTLRQRVPRTAPARVAILREAGKNQGPSKVDDAYRAEGLDVTLHPLNSELPSLAGASLIHISAQIGETKTPREAHLIGAGTNDIVRASTLIRALLPRDEQQLRPFVILDVTDNSFDGARTLLLRNVFASRLFEGARGVLAIGPHSRYELSHVYRVLTSLLHREAFGLVDLHNAFWEQTQQTNYPPALFTLDPDLPVWD
jgi:hypothetical protein